MSTGAHAARLTALTKELTEGWRQTRDLWRDSKAREFEEHYLRPLEEAVNAAAGGIEQLEAELRSIRSDCE
jgi:hypothetical protein